MQVYRSMLIGGNVLLHARRLQCASFDSTKTSVAPLCRYHYTFYIRRVTNIFWFLHMIFVQGE